MPRRARANRRAGPASRPVNHFEQLIGCVPDTNYFAKDRAGRFIEADPGFVEMLGCRSRDQLLGRTDFDFFPREIAAQFVADDQRVMRTGQPLVHHTELVPNPDLTFSGWIVNKVPLRSAAGTIVGIAGITSRLAPDHAPTPYGGRLFAALDHIGRHYAQPLPVATLAKLAGLSLRAFERHFHATLGTTPGRYLTRVRLQAARHLLLRSPKPLADIAVECGFYDQSHMTVTFRRHFGVSPRKYRVAHTLAGEPSATPPPA